VARTCGRGSPLPASPRDGEGIIAAGRPFSPITIWNRKTGEVERTIDTSAETVAVSATGLIASPTAEVTASGQVIDVWDSATGHQVSTLAGLSGAIRDLAFSADGTRLAAAGSDGTIRIWDPDTGEPLLIRVPHRHRGCRDP
jgi:WD40 repeat protein